MLLYDVAAAWVAGVNDVVSLLGSLSFHFGFLHVPKPPVLDQNFVFKLKAGSCRLDKHYLGFSCGYSNNQNQIGLLMWMLCVFVCIKRCATFQKRKIKMRAGTSAFLHVLCKCGSPVPLLVRDLLHGLQQLGNVSRERVIYM